MIDAYIEGFKMKKHSYSFDKLTIFCLDLKMNN